MNRYLSFIPYIWFIYFIFLLYTLFKLYFIKNKNFYILNTSITWFFLYFSVLYPFIYIFLYTLYFMVNLKSLTWLIYLKFVSYKYLSTIKYLLRLFLTNFYLNNMRNIEFLRKILINWRFPTILHLHILYYLHIWIEIYFSMYKLYIIYTH